LYEVIFISSKMNTGHLFVKAVLILIPIIVVPVISVFFFQKYFSNPFLSKADEGVILYTEHRTLSTISTMMSGLFGLMLGLIVVSLWQDYKDLEEKIIQEASSIDVLYSEAQQIEGSETDTIQKLIVKYLDSIIYDAWPLLEKGEESKSTPRIFTELMTRVMALKNDEMGNQEYLIQDMVRRLVDLSTIRKERLYYTYNPRVPRTMWIALFTAGVIITFNTFLLPIANLRKRILLTALYSAMLGITFILIISLNYPFGGAIGLNPDAFKRVKYNIEHLKKPAHSSLKKNN